MRYAPARSRREQVCGENACAVRRTAALTARPRRAEFTNHSCPATDSVTAVRYSSEPERHRSAIASTLEEASLTDACALTSDETRCPLCDRNHHDHRLPRGTGVLVVEDDDAI